MDLALAIFNIGAGLGVLAVGGALIYLAWQSTPLFRESRALVADLRRLARTTDQELRPLLANARELATNAEVLSEDVAVKLDRLGDLMNAIQQGVETGRISVAAEPSDPPDRWPVESWDTREDATDS